MPSDLRRSSYSGTDFPTAFDDILARAQRRYGAAFNDFALPGLGVMLFDLMAYSVDVLSFYLDRRASGVLFPTALTRSEVERLARHVGYKVRAAVPAAVELQVSVGTAQTQPVTIPELFAFRGPSGLVFEAAEAVTIPTSSTAAVTVPCYQGRTESEGFTSDGTARQTFRLSLLEEDEFLALGSVVVKVDGIPWTEADFLQYGTAAQFEVRYTSDPPQLVFGDGIAGAVPEVGNTIEVTYVATKGLAGRVGQNTITAAIDSVQVNFTTVPLTVNNPAPSESGDDPETVAETKAKAPRVTRTRDVTITREDYEAVAGAFATARYGRVANAQAVSPRSADEDFTILSLLARMRALATAHTAPTVTAIDAAAADVTTATTATTTAQTANTTLLTQQAALSGDLTGITTNVRAMRSRTQDVTAELSGVAAVVAAAKAYVDGSSASAGEKTAIKTYFDQLQTMANTASSQASVATSTAGSVLTTSDAATTKATTIGTQGATIAAQLVVVAAEHTSAQANLTTARAAASAPNDVEQVANDVYDHVDRIVSSDCKANVVSVPVLAYDKDGFYVAPGAGLVRELQRKLDTTKEITQVPSVVSGEQFLAPVCMRIKARFSSEDSATIGTAALRNAVDSLLRDRAFGVSLYVSDVANLKPQVAGLLSLDVTIVGVGYDIDTADPARKDSYGNLIVSAGQVVTRGEIEILSEVVTLAITG